MCLCSFLVNIRINISGLKKLCMVWTFLLFSSYLISDLSFQSIFTKFSDFKDMLYLVFIPMHLYLLCLKYFSLSHPVIFYLANTIHLSCSRLLLEAIITDAQIPIKWLSMYSCNILGFTYHIMYHLTNCLFFPVLLQ